jgi:hypothetical protein
MTPDFNIEPHAAGEWLKSAKLALDVFKGAQSLLPKGPSRDELEKKIGDAEAALAASDAALAKHLGYQLCQCSFPPKIMLWREREGAHVCPDASCGRKLHPERPMPRQPVPSARICPLCDSEMKVIKERPHEQFAFAGKKTHDLKCEGCGNLAERDFMPGKGYA